MKKHKTVHFVLVAGDALALFYFAFIYPWPASVEVHGTIGGVKKYNAGQLTDKDVQLSGSQGSTRMSTMEKRIKSLEGRLAPDAQRAVLEARVNYIETRLAVPTDARTAPPTLEAKIAQVEAEALAKSASLPAEQRVADLEAMLFTQTDQRTAPLPTDARTAPAPTDARTAPVPTEARTAPV